MLCYAQFDSAPICDSGCSQLKASAPNHPIVQRNDGAEEAFKNAASAFEVAA